MRKILTLSTMAAMTVFLAACSGSGTQSTTAQESSKAQESKESGMSTDEKAEGNEMSADITLWTYPVGKWGDSATVEGIVKKFNEKYPNIKVSVEYLDYQNGDDQVNTAIEGGQAPDIVLEGPERLVANWGSKGLMVDLNDLFETEAGKEIMPNVAAACKSKDGAYYEYPAFMVAHSMAINKTMFEKADALKYMDLENHTWKTEDFFKAVEAVYASGQENVAAIYCSGQGGDQGTRALVNNLYSGKYTNADHTEYVLNSDENIKALEELKNTKGINFDPAIAGGDEITLFRNGTLAMSFCWNASQQNNKDNAPAGQTNNGDEIIPMLFPTDDAKVELCGGIWGFGIFDNKDENKIAAAKKFIDFVANDPDQVKESVLASSFFPVRSSVTDVYKGQDNEATMVMFEKYFMPSLGDYYQVVPGWATARTEWWNMLQRIGAGGDVKTEVETFVTNANAAAK